MTFNEKLEKCLDTLHGNRESFRALLTNRDAILYRICKNAEARAELEKCPVWSVIEEITGHGSGVSSCIYELYREIAKT